jgi:hypothetical protein
MRTETSAADHDYGYGAKALLLLAVLAALSTALVFRPRMPSPLTAHGAYGAGHGSESLMIGATARKGAAK